MDKLFPVLRIMPVVAFIYGIVATLAALADLQATAEATIVSGSFYTEVRVAYIASIIECFDDLFFWWVMALLSLASLKYMEGGRNAA